MSEFPLKVIMRKFDFMLVSVAAVNKSVKVWVLVFSSTRFPLENLLLTFCPMQSGFWFSHASLSSSGSSNREVQPLFFSFFWLF